MSIEVFVPRAQRRRFGNILRKTPWHLEVVRCRVLLLLHSGTLAADVAAQVGCVRATVYRTLYRYQALGEDAVLDQRRRREAGKLTVSMQSTLLSYLDQTPQDYGWQRST